MQETGDDRPIADPVFPEQSAGRRVRWDVVLERFVFAAVVVGVLLGIGMVVVLLFGNPEYRYHARGAYVRLGYVRVLFAAVLVVSLVITGRRTVSEEGAELRPHTLIAFLLFVFDVVVWACVGPVLPAFFMDAVLALLLPLVAYADTISIFLDERAHSVSPVVLWGLALTILSVRVTTTLFFCL